jgi:hypothetical protein
VEASTRSPSPKKEPLLVGTKRLRPNWRASEKERRERREGREGRGQREPTRRIKTMRGMAEPRKSVYKRDKTTRDREGGREGRRSDQE